jgi:hypothetical protein
MAVMSESKIDRDPAHGEREAVGCTDAMPVQWLDEKSGKDGTPKRQRGLRFRIA